jgi:hypothetical protein
MATIVEKTGIRREKGWLYFLDKKGDVSRALMAQGGGKWLRGEASPPSAARRSSRSV